MNTHSAQPFTIGLVQISIPADPAESLAKAEEYVRQAARLGAQVVCLPELFRGPYFCQHENHDVFNQAEAIPGPSTETLGKVAAEEGVVVLASLFERRGPGVYHNTLAVIDADGTIPGLYRKMHIPDDPGYYEKFFFAPGDTGFKAFDTRFGRVGTLVCWDQWYPEAARLTALQGAMTLFYPTAIGWHPEEKAEFGREQLEAWITVQRGHAVANGIYVAAVNRIGHEISADGGPGIEFWGNSFVAGPMGEILAQASSNREEILLAEVNPTRLETVRRHWPFFRDRRIDAYGGITSRFLDQT
ncbi:N-carbamoylputrescine amidase [Desulfonatronum thiosulfatophilum]|uniref:N-carbamoylputrescine amidase n=1 Tax=Desulfonatronum thiosulfatophilum TaxID=617002 RepID=A0A1G6BWY9_9BACT|nr:carbon-nitrogen hydrolase [Desulfonatronum thiosulfatophilum]SDB25132.1 N-carbamoylputrescine amidase [Desulfonatronum thiosulfatophilum]